MRDWANMLFLLDQENKTTVGEAFKDAASLPFL
jgi:hypothetical protein